jgi:regulator of protease activity HflC (stomatin/prohibitin superfamily)
LPSVIVKKIQDVQIAKQEAQRLAIVEQQALKQQKIKKIQAETRMIEITTNAKAQAERQKIEADAKAYKILKEAKAMQKANELISKSLTPELIKYKYIEKWNGEVPKTFLGNDKNFMIGINK